MAKILSSDNTVLFVQLPKNIRTESLFLCVLLYPPFCNVFSPCLCDADVAYGIDVGSPRGLGIYIRASEFWFCS